jgi:hypothetical protein
VGSCFLVCPSYPLPLHFAPLQWQLVHLDAGLFGALLPGGASTLLRRVRHTFAPPSATDIFDFAAALFARARLTAEASIVALVYVERLLVRAREGQGREAMRALPSMTGGWLALRWCAGEGERAPACPELAPNPTRQPAARIQGACVACSHPRCVRCMLCRQGRRHWLWLWPDRSCRGRRRPTMTAPPPSPV